jgi:hypothetical protein
MTAVEQFFEDLVHLGYIKYPDESLVQDRLKLAIEKEKQQIINAWESGATDMLNNRFHKSAEQYYETIQNKTE